MEAREQRQKEVHVPEDAPRLIRFRRQRGESSTILLIRKDGS
jgi:hypothetical protein